MQIYRRFVKDDLMSTYVMADIHGCFEDMNDMLEKIDFSSEDQLIIAGDYIDRGLQSFEMLQWIASKPKNVKFLCGNHDVEFACNVELLNKFARDDINKDSNKDTLLLYAKFSQTAEEKSGGYSVFDLYGTIGELITNYNVTLNQLLEWADLIWNMEYTHSFEINGKKYVIVHAGYTENIDKDNMDGHYETLEDFYVYARDDAYINGGIEHGVIVAGHTPTLLEEELPYNDGNVYRSYDEEMDCTFYDIDCGCAYRERYANAKLACIRLEDEQVFYI